MKDIRFRAWKIQEKEYYTWDDIWSIARCTDPDGVGIQFAEQGYTMPEEIILEQFTGLHDKNNKPIFEGDLLHNPHDEKYCYLIKWDDDNAMFVLEDSGRLSQYCFHEFWEIIGDIHTTPELLKENNNER